MSNIENKITKRLRYLDDALSEISDSPIPSHIFQVMADFTYGVVRHDRLAIALREEAERFYRVHVLNGEDYGQGYEEAFEGGMIGNCLQMKKPVPIADLANEKLHNESGGIIEFWQKKGIRSVLISPIIQYEEPVGALLFAHSTASAYSDTDVLFGSLLASSIAAALENSKLYQALSDEQVTLKAVLKSSQDAIMLFNEEGRILMANPAASELLNLPEKELLGRHLQKVSNEEPLRELFKNRHDTQLEIQLSDHRSFQVNLSEVQTEYGESVGITAIFRDITLMKDLDQMKTDFVQTVSHDLKNPISSVLLDLDVLQTKIDSDANGKRLSRMEDTLNKMNRLIVNLLDIGKIEAGIDEDAETIDWTELLQDAKTAWEEEAKIKNITFEIAGDPRIPIRANATRITQLLTNLVSNAVEYTPEHGIVRLQFQSLADCHKDGLLPENMIYDKGEAMVVHVVDNGPGIPQKEIPYLFDRFYRCQSARKANSSGNGLGLSIVKTIVEAYNGKVWVTSELNKGSRFSFYLPAQT